MAKRGVWVEVESDLWLPQWVLEAKARERLKQLPRAPGQSPSVRTVTDNELREMRGNDKVPGVYARPATKPFEADLLIPSAGLLSADEVRDIAGRCREGGYGKGPEWRSKGMTKRQWARAVGNFVDHLVELSRKSRKGRVVVPRDVAARPASGANGAHPRCDSAPAGQ